MKKSLTIGAKEPLKDGEFLTGHNTSIRWGDDELHGVNAIDIRYRPDDVVRAEVHMVNFQGEVKGALPEFFVADPATGSPRQVRSITWDDGGVTDLGG